MWEPGNRALVANVHGTKVLLVPSIFAAVIAWALYAIAADGGWRKRNIVERFGEKPLRDIADNALFYARAMATLCVILAAKPTVDPYLPDAMALFNR